MQCRVLRWRGKKEAEQDLAGIKIKDSQRTSLVKDAFLYHLKISQIHTRFASQLKSVILKYIPEVRFFPGEREVLLAGAFTSYRKLYRELKKNGFSLLATQIKSALDNFERQGFVLNFPRTRLDLTKKVAIMGILNLTPDSFYDGGKYKTKKEVLKRVEQMIEEGADIVDVGGESTRPGAERVSTEEEIKRTIPYIRKITSLFDIPLSIDTYKAKVAEEAIEAGAQMVNDISGLRFDPKMARIVSLHKVPLVIMHIKGTPRDMQNNPCYDSLMDEIISYLREGLEIATTAGIDKEKIIVDPGIGFGKRVEHNLFILKRLSELKVLGSPILIGVSRKSFIGKVLDLPLEERLAGSLAATCVAVLEGAKIVRTHDIKETREVVDLAEAILQSRVS